MPKVNWEALRESFIVSKVVFSDGTTSQRSPHMAVPRTRVARAYSSSIQLELCFWTRVLSKNILHTPNSDISWQTYCANVCHTITGQILPCWDNANQLETVRWTSTTC